MTINVYQNGGKLFVGKNINVNINQQAKQKFFQELTNALAQNGAKNKIKSNAKGQILKDCSLSAAKKCGML